MYRELKLLANTEKEDVVLAHVSLALQEIDSIIRSLFTPDNGMGGKKIIVLELNSKHDIHVEYEESLVMYIILPLWL